MIINIGLILKQDSIKIENGRQNNKNTIKIVINNKQYEINISKLYQKSVKSGKMRSIRTYQYSRTKSKSYKQRERKKWW